MYMTRKKSKWVRRIYNTLCFSTHLNHQIFVLLFLLYLEHLHPSQDMQVKVPCSYCIHSKPRTLGCCGCLDEALHGMMTFDSEDITQ